jgi:hypothetical protein
MKFVTVLSFTCVLMLFGCVTAQQQRQADIGPQTFPSGLPQSTPSADRGGPFNSTSKNRGVANPTPTVSPVPPATNQNTYGL